MNIQVINLRNAWLYNIPSFLVFATGTHIITIEDPLIRRSNQIDLSKNLLIFELTIVGKSIKYWIIDLMAIYLIGLSQTEEWSSYDSYLI